MKKLFIFDLDGTLIDAYPAIIASMNYTRRRLGYPEAEPQAIVRAVGMGNDSLVKKFFPAEEVPKAAEIYRQHHRQHLKGLARLLPGSRELLENLKKAERLLAVATNRPRDTALLLLKNLKILPFFDQVLTAEEVAEPKPAPDIILALLEYFGLRPEEALYIGDMTIDAQTGAAAGVETVIVTTGSSSRAEILAADPAVILDSLKNFPLQSYLSP